MKLYPQIFLEILPHKETNLQSQTATLPQVLPPGKLDETYLSLILAYLLHYVKTWWHLQKTEVHNIALSWEEDRAMATGNNSTEEYYDKP